jgi:hypothetical protein
MRLKPVAATLLLVALFGVGVFGGWLLFGDDEGSESAASGASTGDLFAQTAGSGTFTKRGERFVLTLQDASRTTTLFSDRPERRSDSITTEDFVAAYADLFAEDPPNATLSSLEQGQGEFTVELLQPRYDERTDTLSYSARPIGAEGTGFPDRFGSASLFIDSGANTVASGGYACTTGQESDTVWVCTFNGSDYQVQVSDLRSQLSGVDEDSVLCLQAWGGAGGNGATASGGHTGRGGAGGYARTILHPSPSATIGYLIGESGGHGSGAISGGGGGSSTIVGTDEVDSASADQNAGFARSALVIAGGGGGGSYSDKFQRGRDGGAGGTAVATGNAGQAGAGESGHGRNPGGGGSRGDGGSGQEPGADGFGGQGGDSAGSDSVGWQALPKSAWFDDGKGGDQGHTRTYQGGSGGGGWGGGGAGASRDEAGGAGGGGGGSLAKFAEVDDSSAPSECTDPPSLNAAFRIVVFNP